ncbi:MAG: PAS domain-containing protein [Variovorax sp.]
MKHQPSSSSSAAMEFMAGGGEMGALMRAHDWADSPLGPPGDWPQALRTVVRLMLNTGHPMYIWWGAEGACLYNDAYRASIGPERHPGSLGRPAREVWAEIWDVIGPQIEQVMSGGGATWNVDQLVPITRHGRRESVWWTYSYSPIDDDGAPGGIGGVLVLCTETTRHVQAQHRLESERDRLADHVARHAVAENALRESEARFRSALKAGRMGSWETDNEAGIRQWSAEGMALFGLALKEGIGKVGGPDDEYVAALHPEDRHLAARYRDLADRQDSFAAEYRIVRPDGSRLWLQGRGLVVARFPDGRARRLVNIMADVSEHRQAEERLRIEHERLELALVAGRMGAYDMNIEDGVLWWSAQTYELFGVAPENFVPTPDNVLALLPPQERDRFAQVRAEAIARRQPFVHEFPIVRPDGTHVWLGHRGQAEFDAAGRPLRSFGITMDITERKQAEEMLREADRSKDRFIAILAHELRNPLAPIKNAVQVLRLKGMADATARWCHDVIDRQVVQMARLLDDLLDASRVSRGQLRLRLEPIDLMAAIEQAIEIAQPVIDAGKHDFTVRLTAQSSLLMGDLTRLSQVFSNVLINAAKYTPPAGKIALDVERHDDMATVAITDNGIGIEARHLDHIFEIFGQVESALGRSQGGQGIGLSLAKGLVEMHGGVIGVESGGVGKGSRFEIRLPLLPTRDADDQAAVPMRDGLPRARPRILVAEDLKDTADSLALALRVMGHTVDVAYDGEQAVHLAMLNRPDVVLMDLGMPKIDGFEACRRIRATPWGAGVLLVAVTGWGQERDRARTREAGFDHHIVKPIDVATVERLVHELQPPAGPA